MNTQTHTALLCRLDALPDGESRGFDPLRQGQDSIFVVRQGNALHAYRNACPHINGAPMAWRKDAYLNVDRSRIVCHAHGAQFLIATGICTLGPCLGQRLEPVAVALINASEIHLVLNKGQLEPADHHE